ncbi:hypothetical protein DPMN_138915 [Dreissena polymorpha]|uniref:RING-type domain-containing protein n=2 Tax=Dreissena polymorpha TaxID=45954 RepID=A0A9D4G4Q6_DREPO|nr:hypothetical protein DPMN_138915 [Dreissena polymorpha]
MNFNSNDKRGSNKIIRRTKGFHRKLIWLKISNISTKCKICYNLRPKFRIQELSVRRASQDIKSTLRDLDNVTVLKSTTTANTRVKTKRAVFSQTFLNNVFTILRCIFAYDRLVFPRITDLHLNIYLFCRLVNVVFLRFACLCQICIVLFVMQLIIRRLSRHIQANRVINGSVCDLDIPGKFSVEASSQRAIQPLYACKEQGSFTKLSSACKSLSQEAGKNDADDKFKEKHGSFKKDILARLRRNVWLPTIDFIHGFSTSFWLSPALSPVINIINRLAEGRSVHPKESMRHELLRLCTFRTYPTHGKPSCLRLAKAGFYYASQGDEVICYCCAKRISNWNERDNPLRAHGLVSPSCPFLVRNSEVNEPVTNDRNESSNSRLNRILHSLDDLDDQPEIRRPDNGPEASAEVAPSSTTPRSNTTEPASNPQNGAFGYADDTTTSRSTSELPVTASQTAGVSQFTSLPVQRARSTIPAGSFAYSSTAEAPVTVPNARREKATLPQKAESTVQEASNRRSDDIREQLLSENRALKAQSKCLRCRRNDVCIAFLPCGHLVSCEACSTDPSSRKCFSCDAAVKAKIKAFIA